MWGKRVPPVQITLPFSPMLPAFYFPHPWQASTEFNRAVCCLRARLSAEQLEEFDRIKAFRCQGNVSGVMYRIEPAYNSNVRVLPSGYPICVVTNVPLQIPDHMLMQKLYIETDERYFLRVGRIEEHFVRAGVIN